MVNAAHVLRLNAVELLRSPGATRRIDAALSPEALGIEHDNIAGDVVVLLEATSGIDGISVHGTLSTPWKTLCRRCLIDVAGVAVSDVDERFQLAPSDADTLAIVGDQIDLVDVVREYVLLDVPDAPLCRDDCAGICPECGADRNQGACDCDTTPRDLRWSALEGLQLDIDDPPDGLDSGRTE
jgi:uncharacterized protein